MKHRRALGLALLLAAAAVAPFDARAYFAAWLAAWWWVFSLAVGGMVNLWIHALTGGRWGRALAVPTLAAARRRGWVALLAAAWLAGAPQLYPWLGDHAGWAARLDEPAFASHWFSAPGFGLRLLVYALLWAALAHQRTLQGRRTAAPALMLHLLGGTLLAADALMTLGRHWTSSGFGLVVLSSQALAGTALAIVAGAAAAGPRNATPPVSRDLGNLLLMWASVWAYLAFMQFLVIWAEDLPRETVWLLPRLQGPWRWGGLALVLLAFVLPLALLLSRAVKDDPRRLRGVAMVVLAGTALDAAWTVLPSVVPGSALAPPAAAAIAGGLLLLLFGDLLAPGRAPQEAPHADG